MQPETVVTAGSKAGVAGPGRSSRWGRVASYFVTVFALVSLNFFLPRVMPGDPISSLLSGASSGSVQNSSTRAALMRYYGLDRPLLDQYGHYLRGLLHGDLGVSVRTNSPVAHQVLARLPWTLLLVGSALLLATAVGLVAGVHSGWRRGRPVDRRLLTMFLAANSLPAFFLAVLAQLLFAVKLHWLPLDGARTPFASLSAVGQVSDIARHLALPAVVLGLGFAAYQFLVVRSGMVSELGADYLLLGRAKGLRERRLKYRYAARNALLPVVTLAALQLGTAVTAGILVERVFAYPGMGRLLFDAIEVNDYPTLQGCFLVLTLLVVTANLFADMLYAHLDPRVSA